MWHKQRYFWQLQNHVWIQNFSQEQLDNCRARKICVSLRGPMTWKVMPRNVWNDIVSWQTDWRGSKVHQNTELWTELMVSQLNSSGISFQDSPRCSSATKFKSYCWDSMKHQRILQEGLSSCRCLTTSHGDQRTTRQNASQMLNSSLSMQRDLEQDNGHSSDLDQKRNGILLTKPIHKENGTELRSRWC